MFHNSRSSLRTHLDVEALLRNAKETRGRPAFRSTASRTSSVDGCFSRPPSDETICVGTSKHSGRANSASHRSTSASHRSTSVSSAKSQGSQSSQFPFRATSIHPGIPPPQEVVFAADAERSGSSRSEVRSASIRSAVSSATVEILQQRDVSRKTVEDVIKKTRISEQLSIVQSCERRYMSSNGVTTDRVASRTRKAPLRAAHRTAAPSSADVESQRIRRNVVSLWNHVCPLDFTARNGLPTNALMAVASFLSPSALSSLAAVNRECSRVCSEVSQQHEMDLGSKRAAAALDAVRRGVSVGYWEALLALCERSAVSGHPLGSVSKTCDRMMKVLVMISENDDPILAHLLPQEAWVRLFTEFLQRTQCENMNEALRRYWRFNQPTGTAGSALTETLRNAVLEQLSCWAHDDGALFGIEFAGDCDGEEDPLLLFEWLRHTAGESRDPAATVLMYLAAVCLP